MQQKKSQFWLRCILPENRSLGSLSFNSLILVKNQEPEQASKCPRVREYHKNRNVYLNEATIVTSQRKNIKHLYLCTRLVLRRSLSTFRFEYEYFLRLKVLSTRLVQVLRKAVLEYSITVRLCIAKNLPSLPFSQHFQLTVSESSCKTSDWTNLPRALLICNLFTSLAQIK